MSYAKYLDASAATQLVVVGEARTSELRQFFQPRTGFVMTPFCFYETLSTLKAKWRGRKDATGKIMKITDQQYHDACYLLLRYASSGKIEVDHDLDISSTTVQPELEQLAQRHGLDISDALQLLTLTKGKNRHFVDEPQSLLITDDKLLSQAAKKEGLRYWFLADSKTKPS